MNLFELLLATDILIIFGATVASFGIYVNTVSSYAL
jgi:hypothetical protein